MPLSITDSRPYPRVVTLTEELAGWTDWDYAAYLLGSHLGVLTGDFPRVNKHLFWTDNRLGNGLRAALLALADGGVLEWREADDQFRWVSNSG